MRSDTRTLSWLHIGDLHITLPDRQNLEDLRRTVVLANGLPPGSLDFAVLPGDNADDGTEGQFRLVRDAMAPLRLALHILPGDHDFKPRNLDAFHRVLQARTLPYAVTVKGYRCLFLDVVSAGSGGPDFRLDPGQLDWIERELAGNAPAVVFMHTYPADLRQGSARLRAMLASAHVRCVDMGHTHYNELANDGRTIFMATRSTGQTEEGPAGFSIAAIDGGCVSWRFKPLDDALPFVVVTQPVDRQLMTPGNQVTADALLVRVKVLADAAIESVEMSVDFGDWLAVPTPVPDEIAVWQARLKTPARNVRVRARDSRGRWDQDEIMCAADWQPPRRFADGSDRDRVGAWPAKGILGTQLGPNRNGQQW